MTHRDLVHSRQVFPSVPNGESRRIPHFPPVPPCLVPGKFAIFTGQPARRDAISPANRGNYLSERPIRRNLWEPKRREKGDARSVARNAACGPKSGIARARLSWPAITGPRGGRKAASAFQRLKSRVVAKHVPGRSGSCFSAGAKEHHSPAGPAGPLLFCLLFRQVYGLACAEIGLAIG